MVTNLLTANSLNPLNTSQSVSVPCIDQRMFYISYETFLFIALRKGDMNHRPKTAKKSLRVLIVMCKIPERPLQDEPSRTLMCMKVKQVKKLTPDGDNFTHIKLILYLMFKLSSVGR